VKIFLEVDVKPFRGKDKAYSGLYTPKGRRNQRARIEIDSEQAQLDQVGTLGHEWGHFLADMYSGTVHKMTPGEERREHVFANLYGSVTKEMFRRYLCGESLKDFESLLRSEKD
jgi:hypothetical protein